MDLIAIFKILIIIAGCFMALFVLLLATMMIMLIVRALPLMRKENLLYQYGWYFDKGYWCSKDRSLKAETAMSMSYRRLDDYLAKCKEKDSNDDTASD